MGLAKGIKAVGDSVKKESGKDFCLDARFGYIHSCPTNLGTGMRASVHIDLPGWTKHGVEALQKRCEELHLQPRGTRGESGGQTGFTYDISNKHSRHSMVQMTFLEQHRARIRCQSFEKLGRAEFKKVIWTIECLECPC